MSTLDGIKVLVVDDDDDALALLEALLQVHGASVSRAASVDAAVEMLKVAKPHVIVSDINMPERDGYQLMRMIRCRPQDDGGLTPAIALTAHVDAKDHSLALLAGYSMHLGKPFKPEALVAAIRSLAPHA